MTYVGLIEPSREWQEKYGFEPWSEERRAGEAAARAAWEASPYGRASARMSADELFAAWDAAMEYEAGGGD